MLKKFKEQWENDSIFPNLYKDLSKKDKSFYMLKNKKGFVVLNVKKTKIVRLHKIDKSIKVCELIELAKKHLDKTKPIYIYVNKIDIGLIKRLKKLNFYEKKFIKNKYKTGDEFLKMELKGETNESYIKS